MKATQEELYYNIALSFVNGIGPKMSRQLVKHFGTAANVLKASVKELTAVEGMGLSKAQACKDPGIFQRAETELLFAGKNGISILISGYECYPARLADCSDPPLVIYYKGTADLNAAKVVAVVGTRKHTDYGMRLCTDLVEGLSAEKDMIIVSGLAHGIDTIAHKESLRYHIPTVGVMGNGLDTIYPSVNKGLATAMLDNGGLLTEFPSQTKIDKGNFPARNRVVAGLSDITVVVESDTKGGALITAHVASSYNREVAAFPGRVYDNKSSGTNELIRKNIATMITSAGDLQELMGWNRIKKTKVRQLLLLDLSPEEKMITDLLQSKDSIHADELLYQTGWNSSVLASVLLQLEMQDIIKSMPGKYYRMN